jgi:hypothetical protein
MDEFDQMPPDDMAPIDQMPPEQMPGGGMEPVVPYGAELLMRVHEDAALLLMEYDSLMAPLDNPDVRAHMTELLKTIDKLFIVGTERLFKKAYKQLPPLDGGDGQGQGAEPAPEAPDEGGDFAPPEEEAEEEPEPEPKKEPPKSNKGISVKGKSLPRPRQKMAIPHNTGMDYEVTLPGGGRGVIVGKTEAGDPDWYNSASRRPYENPHNEPTFTVQGMEGEFNETVAASELSFPTTEDDTRWRTELTKRDAPKSLPRQQAKEIRISRTTGGGNYTIYGDDGRPTNSIDTTSVDVARQHAATEASRLRGQGREVRVNDTTASRGKPDWMTHNESVGYDPTQEKDAAGMGFPGGRDSVNTDSNLDPITSDPSGDEVAAAMLAQDPNLKGLCPGCQQVKCGCAKSLDAGLLNEVKAFLEAVSQAKSFGEEGRLKSYHYHKIMDEIAGYGAVDDKDFHPPGYRPSNSGPDEVEVGAERRRGLTMGGGEDDRGRYYNVHHSETGETSRHYENEPGDMFLVRPFVADRSQESDMRDVHHVAHGVPGEQQDVYSYISGVASPVAGEDFHHQLLADTLEESGDTETASRVRREPTEARLIAETLRQQSPRPDQKGKSITELSLDEWETKQKQGKALKQASGFLKMLAREKAFGDAHRTEARKHCVALADLLGSLEGSQPGEGDLDGLSRLLDDYAVYEPGEQGEKMAVTRTDRDDGGYRLDSTVAGQLRGYLEAGPELGGTSDRDMTLHQEYPDGVPPLDDVGRRHRLDQDFDQGMFHEHDAFMEGHVGPPEARDNARVRTETERAKRGALHPDQYLTGPKSMARTGRKSISDIAQSLEQMDTELVSLTGQLELLTKAL